MPVATLTFNLPEEQVEFDLANYASVLKSIILELDTNLRNKLKYSSPDEDRLRAGWEDAREQLRLLIDDCQLNRLIFEE